ncbi:UPF0481 protein At3g47200-like [Hibiscus syriacus]|uniref:UPF0481 protein At3g47200-like n=1 Tax=Hibiscus syriacus TaxID=106335 RepID=UPI0019204F30|nr:UPF0481 protein At3g47200-like [Hibiscus syriacus]
MEEIASAATVFNLWSARNMINSWRRRWRSPDIELGSAISEPEPTPETDRPSREVECAIYEVPHRLRKVKKIAYEPNVISIGPYHHNKKHLKAMEVVKRSCFDQIVEVTKLEFSEFLKAMIALEEQVRKCYKGPIDQCDNLVEMMVYDGCFIVQLIRNIYPEVLYNLARHSQTDMWYDLLLLENQLPFFVLFKLDCMIMRNGEGDLDEFARSAIYFFQALQVSHIWSGNGSYTSPAKDIKHLLDLVHSCCRPSPPGIRQHQRFKVEVKQKSDSSWKFIRSATELEDAGIGFLGEKVLEDNKKEEDIKSLFDITFTKETKVLKIPTLHVDDNTERVLRNFMAYEQFTRIGEPTYVSDYVVFMDNLINTGKDVQLLCNNGIIDNWLGDDEVVAQMFNKLRDFICFTDDFYYAETFVRVNEHCKRKWNKYMAILKKDYFNSPWSLCSFVAAVVLLLVTVLQTIYTVLSYHKQ